MARTKRGGQTPSLDDQLDQGQLSHEIVEALEMLNITTFRGFLRRHRDRLFKHILFTRSSVSAKDMWRLNRELIARNLRPIWPEGVIVPDKVISVTVLDALWRHRIRYAHQVANIEPTRLRAIVGKRRFLRVVRHVEEIYKEPLISRISWLIETEFSPKVFELLAKFGIRTVSELFAWDLYKAREYRSPSQRRDVRRTVLYMQWWFEKKRPKLVSRFVPN